MVHPAWSCALLLHQQGQPRVQRGDADRHLQSGHGQSGRQDSELVWSTGDTTGLSQALYRCMLKAERIHRVRACVLVRTTSLTLQNNRALINASCVVKRHHCLFTAPTLPNLLNDHTLHAVDVHRPHLCRI